MADSPTHVVVEETSGGLFSNIVAIIGLIILIVVVIWGLVHLASLSKNWFSGIFPGSAAKITVQAPASVNSGAPFTVSWKYPTSDKGNYAFLYQCRTGLQLTNAANAAIPCGYAYTVGNTTSITVTPSLSGTATTSLPLSIIFLPNATSSKQVQGSAVTLVRASGEVTNVPTPITLPAVKPVPNPVVISPSPAVEPTPIKHPVATYPSHPSTPSNLTVRIIAIGVIDPATGAFANRPPMNPNEVAAAQFDIANNGGSTSGVYTFSASLPSVGGYNYNSPIQAPLGAGDHVMNTLRWNQSAPNGTFSVTIIAGSDSYNADNYASATIGGVYNTYPPQPTNYPQYQY